MWTGVGWERAQKWLCSSGSFGLGAVSSRAQWGAALPCCAGQPQPKPTLGASGRAGGHFCDNDGVPRVGTGVEDSQAPDFTQGQEWEALCAEAPAPPTALMPIGPGHPDPKSTWLLLPQRGHFWGACLTLTPTGSPGGEFTSWAPHWRGPDVCVWGAGSLKPRAQAVST